MSGRDPETSCGSQSPFEGTFGYRSEYQNGNGLQSRNGFNLGSFVKDTAVGFLMGGFTSATFYGAGKGVEALQNSVRSVHKSGSSFVAKPNQGQGFSSKGYNPQPGERTLKGYEKQTSDPEISLYTKSSGFNNNPKNIGGQFKRFGANEHYGLAPHVHQPVRNVTPNGMDFWKDGKRCRDRCF